MTEKTERLHIEAALDQALRHFYDYAKAERTCELDDRIYKKWDGRGFHSLSLEAGRVFSLVELCPDLSERADLHQIRKDAREDAQAEWRERVFAEFMPQPDVEDEPGESGGITDTSTPDSSSTAEAA